MPSYGELISSIRLLEAKGSNCHYPVNVSEPSYRAPKSFFDSYLDEGKSRSRSFSSISSGERSEEDSRTVIEELARISESDYYSSLETAISKEKSIMSVLSTWASLLTKIKRFIGEMDSQLSHLYNRCNGLPGEDYFSQSHKYWDLKEHFTGKIHEDFRKWAAEVPDLVYDSGPTCTNLSNILYELKIMKYNYIQEASNEARTETKGNHKISNPENFLDSNYVTTSKAGVLNLIGEMPREPTKLDKHKISKLHKTKSKSSIQCAHCATIDTPEWRRGPSGTRSLCNACGLFFAKLCRRFGEDEANAIMQGRKSTCQVHNRTIPPSTNSNLKFDMTRDA